MTRKRERELLENTIATEIFKCVDTINTAGGNNISITEDTKELIAKWNTLSIRARWIAELLGNIDSLKN